jgi:CBS domain-containing protein
MFHIHGIQGRVFSGTLAQLRQQQLVTGVARTRRIAPVMADGRPPTAAPAAGGGGGHGAGAEAVQAYGQAARARQPLTCAADVMHSPALTVPAAATLREAWLVLARHGIAQAPVVVTCSVSSDQ